MKRAMQSRTVLRKKKNYITFGRASIVIPVLFSTPGKCRGKTTQSERAKRYIRVLMG